MAIRRWVVGAVCLLGLFAAACGGGEGEDAGQDAGDASGAIEITAANFAFSPLLVPVEPGAEVELTFTNDDDTQHSFTADDLGVDLVLEGGTSDTTTFTAPDSGSVEFHCKFHDSMRGLISVDGSGGGSGGSGDPGEESDDLDY